MHLSNLLPTLMSLVALLFSGYSLYEAALRAPQLSVFVSPRIDYTDPDRPEDVREVFILPVTIANDGARPGTILALTLDVTNPRTQQTKTFYAARLGVWGEQPVRPFAPIVLAGRQTYSHALQFEPRKGETVARILDLEPGTYQFRITVDTAAAKSADPGAPKIQPLRFTMQAGQMDYRMFNGSGTMELWVPDSAVPQTAN